MNIDEFRDFITEFTKIEFTRHAIHKLKIRGIPEEEVIKNLKDPKELIAVEDQGEEKGSQKFALLFSKSRKYDLKVVISIKNGRIKVITAHIQNIKKREKLRKWLKKQR